mgnify:CR=1 FL=1
MSLEKAKKWRMDQLQRALFFHRKFHEYGMIELAEELDQLKGERYEWALEALGISEIAWNIAIHRGIKPVLVFCHPDVIMENPRRIAYYRMLAILSQKSMQNIGLPTQKHEFESEQLDREKARSLAITFNKIISAIVEDDPEITVRELDMLRAMSAGTQADGSWRNRKGDEAEEAIKALIKARIREKGLLYCTGSEGRELILKDGRVFVFGKEPDVGVYHGKKLIIAIEIKGGIDPAGVHERYGAALKSLEKAKKNNRECKTILIMARVSLTSSVEREINESPYIDQFFDLEGVMEHGSETQQEFFRSLNL